MNINSKKAKVISVILLISVLVLFLSIPAAIVGTGYDNATDNIAETTDNLDGSNDFVPGSTSGQSAGSKIIDAFDGSGKN